MCFFCSTFAHQPLAPQTHCEGCDCAVVPAPKGPRDGLRLPRAILPTHWPQVAGAAGFPVAWLLNSLTVAFWGQPGFPCRQGVRGCCVVCGSQALGHLLLPPSLPRRAELRTGQQTAPRSCRLRPRSSEPLGCVIAHSIDAGSFRPGAVLQGREQDLVPWPFRC